MKTKQEWINYLHLARQNQSFEEKRCSFFGHIENGQIIDLFLFSCLVALYSKAGDDFAEILNQNIPKVADAGKIHEKWNASKSPVRNFLLVRHIDYPLEK